MKHRIITMFSALLILFALVPPTFANAVGYGDYDDSEFRDTTQGFFINEYLSHLQDNGKPFFCIEQTFIVTNRYSVNNGKTCKAYIVIYPANGVSTFVKNGNIVSLEDGSVMYFNRYTSDKDNNTIGYDGTIKGLPDYHQEIGPFDVNYEDMSNEYPAITNTYYYYNSSGQADLGDNAFIPPTPINEQDMLDLPVGTLRLMYPINNAHLTVGDSGAQLEILIDGKSGYLNDLPNWLPDIAGTFYAKYLDDAMTKDFSISVNGKTVNAKVDKFNKFGKSENWQENEYVTFEGLYKVPFSELKQGLSTITFGANVLMPTVEDIYKMEWKTVTVELNIVFQKDLNGDGLDDDTGQAIVDGAYLDNDGDGVPDGTYNKPTDENGTDFFSGFVNSIKNVPQYSSEIGRAFSSIFNMFPSPIPQLAVTGIIIMIFVAVISFIRRS